MKIIRYIVNLLLAVDQLVNTILLGHPDESLSSRLGRTRGKERYIWVKCVRKAVDVMFFFDTAEIDGRVIHHCEKSIMPLEQKNFREMVDYEIWSWSK